MRGELKKNKKIHEISITSSALPIQEMVILSTNILAQEPH
jgi:hypothetical protein